MDRLTGVLPPPHFLSIDILIKYIEVEYCGYDKASELYLL